MPSFKALTIYHGPDNPLARRTRPAEPLDLRDDGRLAREIAKAILGAKPGVAVAIGIPGLRPVTAYWHTAGSTAATVVWSNEPPTGQPVAGAMAIPTAAAPPPPPQPDPQPPRRRQRAAQAITLLRAGVDPARELLDILAACAARRLPVPHDLPERIDDIHGPLAINVFYSLAAILDPVVNTAAPAFAVAFFGTLGVDDETDDELGQDN